MNTEVVTSSGPVSGLVESAGGRPAVAVYRGIPYAAPPVGPLRFAPPAPHPGWTTVFEATEFGHAPIQGDSPLTAGLGVDRSEDCLTLNVWTPAPGGEPRPVLVWFYGGAFSTGGSSISWYDGVSLARRDVVVVTLNYRLGPLGFLHLEPFGGEEWHGSANLGLFDQAAALEWVQTNIGAFGGDPGNVTVFGESAGAMSACTHLGLPASRGRFSKVIAQSGAAHSVHTSDSAAAVAEQVLAALGVGSDLATLRSLPAERFVDAQSAVADRVGAFLPLPFQPTVDGSTLPVAPLDSVAGGGAGDIPLLLGTNLEEMKLWTALARIAGAAVEPDESALVRRVERALGVRGVGRRPEEVVERYRSRLGATASPFDVLDAVGADLVFRLPAIELAGAHHRHAPTYMYLFTHRSSSFGGMLGAAHAIEIPFAWDNLDAAGTSMMVGDVDEGRRGLARRMADAWVAFARTGDPSTDLDPWPRYDVDRRSTKIWETEPSVVDDPHGAERELWGG